MCSLTGSVPRNEKLSLYPTQLATNWQMRSLSPQIEGCSKRKTEKSKAEKYERGPSLSRKRATSVKVVYEAERVILA